jgi:hypothetical protein
MKTITNNNNYSLINTNNYKKKLEENTAIILDKYVKIIIEYLKYILENHKIKNSSYKKFILIRGLETISHVFHFILYYTNNLEISNFHSQKAIYFYVEFIQQTSSEENSFLQLNSGDAVMYVYKKTIFDINNEYRKNTNNNWKKETNNDVFLKWDTINCSVNILKNILLSIVNSKNGIDIKFIDIYEDVCKTFIQSNFPFSSLNQYILFIKKINIYSSVSSEKYIYLNKLFIKIINNNTEIDLVIKSINKFISNLETNDVNLIVSYLEGLLS